PTFSARKVWLAVPLLLLGILSKETMVILPALATVTLFCISPKRFDPRIYLPTWPLWLISLGYVHWRSNNPNFDGPLTYKRIYAMPQYEELRLYAETFSYRIYTFFSTLPDYLELLLWPHGLHMDRFFPVAKTLFAAPVLGGMLMVALGAGYVVWSYWNKPREKHAGKAAPPKLLDDRRALSWGLLWFATAHAPDSGLLFSINSMFLEHWMYLPTTGLFLGLAQTLTGTLRKCPPVAAKTVAASVLLFAAVLSAKTIAQNAIWQNPDTFYNNIFNNGDESARTRNNLALYYSKMGRNDEAIQQFLRSIALSDTYAESRFNLALLYLNNPKIPNNVDLAIENLKRSIEIQPTFYRSYKTLGEIYKIVLHDEEKAKIFMDKASELYQLRQ
ncbi:MAG: tetratricopeptide repeat protein, partial [Alphaproteobacteria bacterium]|nr:tetratricopeptide repeat protein [Alphaproteobacteria bacterium]